METISIGLAFLVGFLFLEAVGERYRHESEELIFGKLLHKEIEIEGRAFIISKIDTTTGVAVLTAMNNEKITNLTIELYSDEMLRYLMRHLEKEEDRNNIGLFYLLYFDFSLGFEALLCGFPSEEDSSKRIKRVLCILLILTLILSKII